MASKKKQKVTFEEGMRTLESVIAAMNEGGMSLEESMQAYEEGMLLCSRLEEILHEHTRRIEQIDLETAEITDFEG